MYYTYHVASICTPPYSMSWLGAIAIGYGMAWRLARHNRRHGMHKITGVRPTVFAKTIDIIGRLGYSLNQ